MPQTIYKPTTMSEDTSNEKVPPRLWGSCRLSVTLLCLLAVVHIYYMRFNLSMAMVCMTGTMVNGTEDSQAIEGEFSWSRGIIGNIQTSFFYGYIATPIVAGIVVDRFGARKALIISMVTLALTSLVCPETTRFHHGGLMALRVIQGLASGFAFCSVNKSLAVWTVARERNTLFSIAFAGVPLANFINFPLSSALCYAQVDQGWPLIFYVPGITAVIWCLAFYFMASDTPSNHPRITAEERAYFIANSPAAGKPKPISLLSIPWKHIFLSLPIWAVSMAQLGSTWIMYLVALNLPLFINETFNLGIVYNGLLCTLPFLGLVIMNSTGKLFDVIKNKGKWSTNHLRKLFNTIGLVFPAILFCLLPYFPSNISQIIILTICASLKQLSLPAAFYSHPDVAGKYSGICFGISNTFVQIAGFINAILIPIIVPNKTREEWQNVFYIAAGVGFFCSIFYLIFGTGELQPWAKDRKDLRNVEKGQETKEVLLKTEMRKDTDAAQRV